MYRLDAALMVAGSVFSVMLASIVLSGWPQGLRPNLSVPYIYGGDGLSQYAMIQRAIEGWAFNNDRLGFPFGSPWLDYPGSDAGNLFVSKILGLLLGSYYAASNAYILLGFGVNFAAAFFVMRQMRIRPSIAFSAALLFAFAPYHLARLLMGHTFYTWYFAVPLYFYCAYCVFTRERLKRSTLVKFGAALLITSSFGVYFALFGVITILVSGAAAAVRRSSYRPLVAAALFGAVIAAGVGANVAPNVIYTLNHGKNLQVAQRSPIETEIFSLKPIHLVLPPPSHRIAPLGEFSARYFSTFPLSNVVSYIGVIGLFGLAVLAFAFLRATAGLKVDSRLGFLVLLTGSSLIIATVGGLNVLFAMLVSPSIRGWDRFSIFIAFYALCAAAVWVSARWPRKSPFAVPVLAAVVVVGLADQTASSSYYISATNEAVFKQDRELVSAIEASLPPGSAIYQLPYMPFPESGLQHKLQDYAQLTGFLNSKSLKWSAGGMKGRKASERFRRLAKKPLSEQLAAIKQMGFAGIYVHHAGYADNGDQVVRELTQLTGRPPDLTRADGAISFFRIE